LNDTDDYCINEETHKKQNRNQAATKDDYMTGHILTVQSNQFCAVQKAECAVQVAKLCSQKYVL